MGLAEDVVEEGGGEEDDDDGGGVDVGRGELEDEDMTPPSHLPKADRHPVPQ